MPISRRGLTAAGLALAAVGALGVASTLNASAAQVARTPTPPAPARGLGAALQTPPPTLPGGGRARNGPAAKGPATRSVGGETGAEPGTPPQPTPRYAPKGQPPRAVAKHVRTATAALPAATAGDVSTRAAQQSTENYFYAQASQTAAADGIYATMTIAKPELAETDLHSLAEVAARAADGHQTVEIGWTVDRAVNNGSDEPHLFVYHWVDGQPTCYNACGFVPYPAKAKVGSPLPVGAAKRFGVQHFSGSWWVMYDNEWVGYFPDALWSSPFTRIGVAQWFGEVAATTATPCTQMGTGITPGQTGAAEIRGIGFVGGPPVKLLFDAASPYYKVSQTSSTAYRYGGAGADDAARVVAGLKPC